MSENNQFEQIKHFVFHTECSICLETFKDHDDLALINGCSHLFHKSCLTSALIHKHQCPVCRKDIMTDAIKKNIYTLCVLNRICKWFDDAKYEIAKKDIIRVVESFNRDNITLSVKEADIPTRLAARRIVYDIVDTIKPLFPLPEGEDNILHHHIIADINAKIYRHGSISYLIDKYPSTSSLFQLPDSNTIGNVLTSVPTFIYNSISFLRRR